MYFESQSWALRSELCFPLYMWIFLGEILGRLFVTVIILVSHAVAQRCISRW